jgi:TetR/AcrR family transcriptional regulator, transcriptional repressor for nem operon
MPRPRTFEEDDVVAAARAAFWSGGYAGTSLDDLTTATGLGKGSLYGAFGDKHTLFLRALDGYCESALQSTRDQLRGPVEGAYRRLADFVRALTASNTADTARLGCLMAKSAAELAGTDAEVREKVRHTLTGIHTELTGAVGGPAGDRSAAQGRGRRPHRGRRRGAGAQINRERPGMTGTPQLLTDQSETSLPPK